MSTVYGPKWPFYSCCNYIGLLGTSFIQVIYLGRDPHTKETLPDFLKWHRVTRHPLVFRGLTGSQRTPGNGASQEAPMRAQYSQLFSSGNNFEDKNKGEIIVIPRN